VLGIALIKIPWNLELGEGSAIGAGVIIYNLGKVSIGRNVTISQYSHLCAGTHDYHDRAFPLVKATIRIDDNVWVCAGAFVGPNVTVGASAIVGACAVVVKDVAVSTVVGGNPARTLKMRDDA
jgi:putative colanic acid biosynthesis acetyltransferase WcaF